MNRGTKGEGRRTVAIAFQKAPKDGKPGLLASDEEVARLVEHARRTDEPPAYVSDTVVEAVGEHLHEPIHWTGRQWAVTDFGVEARNGTYSISKRRLWNEEDEWGWVRQVSTRGWIDMADFAEALRLARRQFAPLPPE